MDDDIINQNGQYPNPVEGDDDTGHGTGQLSKMIGDTLGVVMHSTINTVRHGESAGLIQFLRLLDWILDDWNDWRQRVKLETGEENMMRVINLPVVMVGPPRLSNDMSSNLTHIASRINGLIAAGLLPVCASGNDGGVRRVQPLCLPLQALTVRSQDVNSWPAPFRTEVGEILQVPKPVVVGATDVDGKMWNERRARRGVRFLWILFFARHSSFIESDRNHGGPNSSWKRRRPSRLY